MGQTAENPSNSCLSNREDNLPLVVSSRGARQKTIRKNYFLRMDYFQCSKSIFLSNNAYFTKKIMNVKQDHCKASTETSQGSTQCP